ncbi:(S)-2-hydroxy-acid oxidase [Aspergillus bombycis]|uniref:Dipeptidase n=1 Tax=Aspergillus bombycis TaxID=109264 RepID=A0A1F7ZR68_9EURO|nr:(S)-2-hydroxy-acid oxidase [Aspergillus bombycis]OGM41932.1 (S)-2-hydroxy-acid oxidase [Aspergillus bombycis]
MVLSTFSTVSLEDVISERKEGQNPYAFQPIFPRDRSKTLDWMKRAEKSGYKAIFITVDAPVTANRLRKKRNSLQLPPHLSYPNLSDSSDRSSGGYGHDPSKRWDEVIPWVKANTSLEVWVKGISCPHDVLKAIDYGLDGLVISSHGGRQLDGVAAAIDVLAECAPLAKGRIKIGFDSGIRRGADVFRALALGADICFLGRIPLWGLAYDGQAGVELAVRILEEELRNAMAHAGKLVDCIKDAAYNTEPELPGICADFVFCHVRLASIEERVENILTNMPLIDGHNDLPINIRKHYKNHIYGSNFTKPFADGTLEGDTDLLRLRQGLVGGTFWSVFVPCPKNRIDPSNPKDAPDAAIIRGPDGSTRKSDPLWHGVSPLGKDLIYEMNRIGMIIDLAHVSEDTMRDVLGAGKDDWPGSRSPVIFSHSSAQALCTHPRNVPDDILLLVKERNSVVMVNFAPDFISCTASDHDGGLPDIDDEHATLERVADHIMHIVDVAGIDHVGLGSDFDGMPTTVRGLEDVSKFPALIAELLRRGLTDEDAVKVAGANVLRVWGEVDRVALEMQAEGAVPMED